MSGSDEVIIVMNVIFIVVQIVFIYVMYKHIKALKEFSFL